MTVSGKVAPTGKEKWTSTAAPVRQVVPSNQFVGSVVQLIGSGVGRNGIVTFWVTVASAAPTVGAAAVPPTA